MMFQKTLRFGELGSYGTSKWFVVAFDGNVLLEVNKGSSLVSNSPARVIIARLTFGEVHNQECCYDLQFGSDGYAEWAELQKLCTMVKQLEGDQPELRLSAARHLLFFLCQRLLQCSSLPQLMNNAFEAGRDFGARQRSDEIYKLIRPG